MSHFADKSSLLVPLDRSDASLRAMPVAVRLASSWSGRRSVGYRHRIRTGCGACMGTAASVRFPLLLRVGVAGGHVVRIIVACGVHMNDRLTGVGEFVE